TRWYVAAIQLDALYWQSGWVQTPSAEWRQVIAELLRRDAWIIDGNYSSTLALRLAACDTVIFLDIARLICLWRVLKRAILYRGRTRPDMAGGGRGKVDWGVIRWVWSYQRRTKPQIIALLRQTCAPQKLICHFTDQLIQPQLRLTHQKPITVGNGTRSGCEDRVDISSADGAYQSKATDDRVGERLLHTRHHTDKR